MTAPIILWAEAQQEFDDAVDWYEGHRRGLGARFVDRVQETFDRIADYPELYPVVWGDVRRAVVRRFPYIILYRVRPDRVVVTAIFHTSRDPADWRRRVT